MAFADPHGRRIAYLRLSLTRACQMRCTYCRPTWLRKPDTAGDLTADQIGQIVSHLARNHGVRKVRLTGGDPTARPDLLDIIERVAAIPGIADLAMTTHGLTLAARAADYARAGLHRVNVSLDALDPGTFKQMTGVDGLDRVLRGIDSAQAAGLSPLRLNTVVMRDHNEDQLVQLVELAARLGAEIRFIELMPMGPLADLWHERYVPEREMRQRLEQSLTGWEPLDQHHDSARRFRVVTRSGADAVVGFITPMSCNFCADCNRLRLTASGDVYPCLMDQPRGNIRAAMSPTFDPDHFDHLLRSCLHDKAAEHPTTGHTVMTVLGG